MFRILTISGGGFCGLYAALILEEIERRRGQEAIHKSVDMIVGTSIGGIIALGLAHGIPASVIRENFEVDGSALFDDSGNFIKRKLKNSANFAKSMLFAKYSSQKLKDTISTILPDGKITDCYRPCSVVSVSSETAEPVIISNFTRETLDYRSIDAAMATSAAPTYFAPHKIDDTTFIDGGIIANNPDLIAISNAVSSFQIPLSEISIISIGSTNLNLISGKAKSGFNGVIPNLFSLRSTISFTMESQQHLAQNTAKSLLGERYLRINSLPGGNAEKYLKLDRADKLAKDTLKAMATNALQSVEAEPIFMMACNRNHIAKQRWKNGEILIS